MGMKRQMPAKAYVPTKSQLDKKEKGKGNEEKSADKPDLLRTPRYVGPPHPLPRLPSSHTLSQATLRRKLLYATPSQAEAATGQPH